MKLYAIRQIYNYADLGEKVLYFSTSNSSERWSSNISEAELFPVREWAIAVCNEWSDENAKIEIITVDTNKLKIHDYNVAHLGNAIVKHLTGPRRSYLEKKIFKRLMESDTLTGRFSYALERAYKSLAENKEIGIKNIRSIVALGVSGIQRDIDHQFDDIASSVVYDIIRIFEDHMSSLFEGGVLLDEFGEPVLHEDEDEDDKLETE
jgi:hypothetical protein